MRARLDASFTCSDERFDDVRRSSDGSLCLAVSYGVIPENPDANLGIIPRVSRRYEVEIPNSPTWFSGFGRDLGR